MDEAPTHILEKSAKKAREVLSTLGVLTESEFNMTMNLVMQTKQYEFQMAREKELNRMQTQHRLGGM